MKREMYSKKVKNSRILRTALSVLVCMVFIPLLVANGFLVVLKQGKSPYIMDANSVIAQTMPSLDETSACRDHALIDAQEDTAVFVEDTIGEETEAVTPGDETQGTVYNDSTEPCTERQTEPVTTTVPPATTKPATTKSATTKPAATKPVTTKPATTAPTTTKPVTTPPATTKPATPSNVPCNHLDADEKIMLDLINQERRKVGVPEVKLDTNLRNVAQTKCRELIGLDYFSHQSPVYGSPFEMLTYFRINYTKAGENLAMNTCVEAAHNALMNSEGHRKIMLSPDYTHVGIGAYEGVCGKYYTQMYVRY